MARPKKAVSEEGDVVEKPDIPPTKIKNPDRKGQVVFGISGKPVVFDSEGVASDVSEEEIEYFAQVPGYEVF